jgi:hypothetical protein
MSTQGAKDFIERANQDAAVRKTARERYSEIASVGQEHGFEFTKDEFDQAMRERKGTAGEPAGGDQVCQCGHDTCVNDAAAGVADEDGGGDQVCQCGHDTCTAGS